MSYRITREHVWGGAIEDRTGALAERLHGLAEGGLDLQMIVSRRDQAGWALMFVSPLRSDEEVAAAEKVGLSKAGRVPTLCVEGPNRPGLGAQIATALAEAGLNLRGYWAAALGEQSVTHIAFGSEADQAEGQAVLERALGS